jgi:ankyrin repeat protein
MVELADKRRGRTPLMWAAASRHALVVRLLLDKNANYQRRMRE